MRARHVLLCMVPLLLAASTAPTTVCRNRTGTHDGRFFTFWHDSGTACITLDRGGRYRMQWNVVPRGNVVAGVGWQRGAATRTIGYRAAAFDPGSNGYLTLYGWSRDPLVEYYVVDDWGDFTPPGPQGTLLGTLDSDGGTYRIYRTRRVRQPSIAGTATFDQYWSVRTTRRTGDGDRRITVANHVAAWRAAGLRLGRLDYQVLATEGFGSTGRSDVRVWDAGSD